MRLNGNVVGPLHGIPFLVKDNFASKDRMETTAGSWALQGSIVPRDAYVVSRLRGKAMYFLHVPTILCTGKCGHSISWQAQAAPIQIIVCPFDLMASPSYTSTF